MIDATVCRDDELDDGDGGDIGLELLNLISFFHVLNTVSNVLGIALNISAGYSPFPHTY